MFSDGTKIMTEFDCVRKSVTKLQQDNWLQPVI